MSTVLLHFRTYRYGVHAAAVRTADSVIFVFRGTSSSTDTGVDAFSTLSDTSKGSAELFGGPSGGLKLPRGYVKAMHGPYVTLPHVCVKLLHGYWSYRMGGYVTTDSSQSQMYIWFWLTMIGKQCSIISSAQWRRIPFIYFNRPNMMLDRVLTVDSPHCRFYAAYNHFSVNTCGNGGEAGGVWVYITEMKCVFTVRLIPLDMLQCLYACHAKLCLSPCICKCPCPCQCVCLLLELLLNHGHFPHFQSI